MQTPHRHLHVKLPGYLSRSDIGRVETGGSLTVYVIDGRARVLVHGATFLETTDPGLVATVAAFVDEVARLAPDPVVISVLVDHTPDRGWALAREWQPAQAIDELL